MLSGKRPAALHFFVAVVYVGITPNSSREQCLQSFKPVAVKVSSRTKIGILSPTDVLMLSHRSNLIDHLIGHPPTPVAPASDVVYYYCDYADQRTLHLDRILGSLLKQLFLNREIPEPVEIQLLEIYAGGTRSPAENALSTLLCSIIALHPGLHIILDGLGECDKRVWQAILKLLKRIEASEDSNVKIFITCVEEGPVSHHLANTACLHFSASSSAEDIKAFVTSEVRSKVEDGQLRIRNPKLEQEIISELITRANGM